MTVYFLNRAPNIAKFTNHDMKSVLMKLSNIARRSVLIDLQGDYAEKYFPKKGFSLLGRVS